MVSVKYIDERLEHERHLHHVSPAALIEKGYHFLVTASYTKLATHRITMSFLSQKILFCFVSF